MSDLITYTCGKKGKEIQHCNSKYLHVLHNNKQLHGADNFF